MMIHFCIEGDLVDLLFLSLMVSVLPDAPVVSKDSDNLLGAVRVLLEAVVVKILDEESSSLRVTEIDKSISTILRLLACRSEVWEVEEVVFSGELVDFLSQFVLTQTARDVLNHHSCLIHVDRRHGFARTHGAASGLIGNQSRAILTAEASKKNRGRD
jgi:hypothetical protein